MTPLFDKIKKHALEAEAVWGRDYTVFADIIEQKQLKIGTEIGVAFGGHSESLLKNSSIEKLYGVDPYSHRIDYKDPMNLPQSEFDQLYEFTIERLSPFAQRYQHIRKLSKEAVDEIEKEIDFVYLDADHSYEGVWNDLCLWFPKVKIGGVFGGHDFNHPDFPGVKQAVREFFRRFDWKIHEGGDHIWWVEKKKLNISFFMPAYNCASTIEESIESVVKGNLESGDEIVVCNDGSTDDTGNILEKIKKNYPALKVITHLRNKGGGAARNTAIENTQHSILFCLDSDNLLVPGSIIKLKEFMINSGVDIANFQEIHYFIENKENLTHRWIFKTDKITLADCLAGPIVPISSGNYMFSKDSWLRAGTYPEFAGALDTWGFGFRQLATGSKMESMPHSYYWHRHGYESYWVRDSKRSKISLVANQLLMPFLELIDEKDVKYIMSPEGRLHWFEDTDKKPIRLKSGQIGKKIGAASHLKGPLKRDGNFIMNFFAKARGLFFKKNNIN